MYRSKISRSILVVVFVAFIIFLGYLDFNLILASDTPTEGAPARIFKVLYAVFLVVLTIFYIFMKDKLYRMKIKRKQSLLFRYSFLAVLVIMTSTFMLRKEIASIALLNLGIFLLIKLVTAFIIKKIIFNVSKSDMLSVFALITYAMLPNIIQDGVIHLSAMLITLLVSAAALVLQILIDELKQRGIRTNKYLYEAVGLGLLFGGCTLMGIHIMVWVVLSILLIVITVNLDNTHINFPKKLMNSINQSKREKLYSIERINVSKLVICIGISLLITLISYFAVNMMMKKVEKKDNIIPPVIIENFENNTNFSLLKNNLANFIDYVIDDANIFLSYSKTYYLVLFLYILFIEILAFVLKRRYDTKSTVLKMMFLLIFITISLFNLNMILFQPLLSVLLMLIAIVNTSNIYLNREERVKMLVA